MKTLLLIDGNSILNRAFYGIRPLTNSKGLYTQAVYGMLNILLHHMDALHPDYTVCAFDRKEPTFRHLRYDGYKATRHGMPEELAVQLPWAKKAVEGLGIHLCTVAGYEADDILGTCSAFSHSDPELVTYILTGDKDSFQLIRDNVHVLYVSTGNTTDMTREKFMEKYPGVTPETFVDLKALMGDSSDNIPGVPGIGEKTALKLMEQFGTLDGIYEGMNEGGLTPSVLKKLSEGKDSAYLSKELATICLNAPICFPLDQCRYDGVRREEMTALLSELELNKMRTRLGLDKAEAPDAVQIPSEKIEIVDCDFDKLTIGLDAPCLGISMGEGYLSMSDGKTIRRTSIENHDQLKAFFAKQPRLAVLDAKSLYRCLASIGIDCQTNLIDLTLAAYLLDPGASKYDPARLFTQYLDHSPASDEPSYLCAKLYPALMAQLEETKQFLLYHDIEQPLTRVLAQMENVGFGIDREGMQAFANDLEAMCEKCKAEVFEAAGCEFNLNSPKQLGSVLFETLGLPPVKKTSTGYSTDAESLEKLRPYHPIIDAILEYRQIAKLKSTYADGLLKVADENGRIHSIFHQTVTATGRLSSSEPNLQNIPIKTELGRQFRKYFIPKNDDYLLIDADYSQIELRLLAVMSGDENMIHAFHTGADIHTATAARVFGIPEEAVTAEMRKRAKAVNFGIIYGIGEYSLSQDLGVSRKQAGEYIKQYLDQYPAVRGYMADTVAAARRDGYTTTLFGRRRPIPELASKRKPEQAFGERVAMNSPLQGTAADIMKIAMINVCATLQKEGIDARLILQVHDELILEAHKDCAERAAQILKIEMEKVGKGFPVPLPVDLGAGKTWLDC